MKDALSDFAAAHRLRVKRAVDGTDIIPGKYGHVYEYGEGQLGVLILPLPPQRKYWGRAKAKLLAAGFTVRQSGDGEGAATFDPADPEQAKLAIKVAGIGRRRVCPGAGLRFKARHPSVAGHIAAQEAR